MAPEIHWQQIALRLVLAVIAGALLGMERSRSGHAAGLRTTLLVTLAAAVSMIQMNLLLESNGKPPSSYAVMDVMRLPLGILTGVGFLGAGAIIHKGELVLGLTTAATLWFSTVIGLCLGGGQLILGSVSVVIGFIVLWGLRWFESRIEHYQSAQLRLNVAEGALSPEQLRHRLEAAHFRIKSLSMSHSVSEGHRSFELELRWPSRKGSAAIPAVLADLERLPGVIELEWTDIATSAN
jgi:putative Mg2+ transporter-C (MgtC) family protein